MSDLLFEVGAEEIPARFLALAQQSLRERAKRALEGGGFLFQELVSWVTPRRLVLYAYDLDFDPARAVVRKKGPAARIAFGEDGQPTPALLGFLRKEGGELSQVIHQDAYTYLEKRIERHPLELLADLLPPIVSGLPFAKSMRWGEGLWSFVRPVRWLVALWGREIVPLHLFDCQSGNTTFGLRFFSGTINLDRAEEYRATLEDHFVLVSPAERRQRLEGLVEELAHEVGGEPLWPEGLLDELVFLHEYPTPFRATFPEQYLELPKDVLITVMRHHQKHLPITEDGAELLPYFFCFREGPALGEEIVVRGNQEALIGRLDDAQLFFAQDQTIPLAERVCLLSGISFQEKLGTLLDKTDRLCALVHTLGQTLLWGEEARSRAERTARLAKADLTTALVIELPELQGIMGREYAQRQGELPEVAAGIADHYLPRYLQDRLPTGESGWLVGLADRLDTLGAFFAIGLEPTGSADPFALRRAGQGLLSLLLGKESNLSLETLLAQEAQTLAEFGKSWLLSQTDTASCDRLFSFLEGRLRFLLEEKGFAFEVISAAVAPRPLIPTQALKRAERIRREWDNPSLEQLALSAKRMKNILRTANPEISTLQPESLEPEAQSLLEAVLRTDRLDLSDLSALWSALVELSPKVSLFFDQVLVLCEDLLRRESHLALLQKTQKLFGQFADFSALPF
jgi:glycyl-tRNA synthetase beta chain